MEPQSTFIRANGTIELHAVANVYMHLAFIVGPWHAERDNTFRLNQSFNEFCFFKFGVLIIYILN